MAPLCASTQVYFARATASLGKEAELVLPREAFIGNHVPWKYGKHFLPSRIEAQYLRSIASDVSAGRQVVCHLWPEVSASTIRRLRKLNVPIVREMINTHRRTAKRILDSEFASIHLPEAAPISDALVQEEVEVLSLCDWLFAPSDVVASSLMENGIAASKIIRVPFGWDPQRFPELDQSRENNDEATAIFLGTIGIRKGAHLLLEAWEEANVPGRLLLIGELEDAVAQRCARALSRNDVVHIPFTLDVNHFLRSADFLILPSLEEGAPLVTYEAFGVGIPVIATRMASCDLVEDNVNGIIVDAHDQVSLIDAIRRMMNPADRARFRASLEGTQSKLTWSNAAKMRFNAFTDILQSKKAAR